jgi:TolB-like protein/DNA-binding winged helix-turn-helix (wHTH) protein
MALEVQTGKPCLDVSRYELTVNGKRVKLERQPMDLLILFVQRKGELVTRQEIIDRLWGKNVFVDVDRSINSAIRKIRAALRDDPTAPKFLETVVGKGYRFIGEIDVVDPRSAAPQTMPQNQPAAPHPSSTPRHRSLAFLITGALVLLMATFIWSVIRTRRSGPALGYSIAVLPLANLSGDPSQDYLAQGMTDDLITELAKISSLRVISRTSSMHYAGSTRPLPEIARELRVDAIVEGALVRSGDKLKLTVQLIDAKSDKHLWAERYERDLRDVLSMQYEVAQAISDHLNGNVASVGSAVPVRRHTVSPEAYEAYQRGRFFWNKWTEDGVRKSIEYYQQAIQADPDYAMAYAGLADSYISLGDFAIGVLTPQQSSDAAEAAALKAISLDDSLAEAHSALAMARFRYGHLAEDEREFKRARVGAEPGIGGRSSLLFSLSAGTRPRPGRPGRRRKSL